MGVSIEKRNCQTCNIVWSHFIIIISITTAYISLRNSATKLVLFYESNKEISVCLYLICLLKLPLNTKIAKEHLHPFGWVEKKATGSESSLSRFRLGASVNTTGNIKPQISNRVITQTPTSSPSPSKSIQ